MRFNSWEELKEQEPFCDGEWDKCKLEEYLIQSCNRTFELQINQYFAQFQSDGELADLLFDFLLDDYYEETDCQMGAAYYLGKMDTAVLKERKELLLKAQMNEVCWRRPFQTDDYLEWI